MLAITITGLLVAVSSYPQYSLTDSFLAGHSAVSRVHTLFDTQAAGPAVIPVNGIMYGVDRNAATIYRIDRLTGATSNTQPLTLAGFTINNTLALAARPSDSVLFAIVQTGTQTQRRLVRVNPITGVCTDVGPLAGEAMSTLAFRPSTGILYGGSGSSGPDPFSLFILDTTTAASTVQFGLIADVGDVFAFAPDGFLYHATGTGADTLDRINVDSHAVTIISTTNQPGGEAFAMGYSAQPAAMYLSCTDTFLYTVDLTTGTRTVVGPIGGLNRGIAIVNAPSAANVPISGRVIDSRGSGIRGARVAISDSRGNTLTALTNAFGYYTFASVPSGDTYIANATSRGMTFAPRVVTLNDAVANLDLVAR